MAIQKERFLRYPTTSFVRWWATQDSLTQDKFATRISKICNVSIWTFKSWGYGYRTPKIRSRLLITEELNKMGIPCNVDTLFPLVTMNEAEKIANNLI